MRGSALRQAASRPERVLLLAAACNPYKGSDAQAGWGRVLETARYFDTWVICGAWDREDIQRFHKEHGEHPGLHFFFVAESRLERLLKRRRPLFYTNLFSYHLWHRRAYKLAARLHQELRFALTHQVTLVGYREPGFLWKLDAPFIWGPLGGTQNYPWRFLPYAGISGAITEGFRSLVNWLQLRLSPRVRRAALKAACLLAANMQNKRDFERVHGIKATLLLETGLSEVMPQENLRSKPHRPLNLLWSGEFKHRKALHLLLRALSRLPPELPYELKILGQGPLERRWRKLAERLGVEDRCRWLGWLPYEEALHQYEWADVLVFTSLRDTSGNVVLEALGQGVPVIVLDHQGVGDIVTAECGVKIPVTTPRKVIHGLRDAIVAFAEDEKKYYSFCRGALSRAHHYLWSFNGARMAAVYHKALAANPHNQRLSPSPISRDCLG
jgi:glycosyltransferase involved in cell wall biosynthesis